MNMSAENTAGERWTYSEWGSWDEELSEWGSAKPAWSKKLQNCLTIKGRIPGSWHFWLCAAPNLCRSAYTHERKTMRDKEFAEERLKSSWQFLNCSFHTFSCRKWLTKALRSWAEFPQTWKFVAAQYLISWKVPPQPTRSIPPWTEGPLETIIFLGSCPTR